MLNIAISCGDCNGIGLEVFLKAIEKLPNIQLQNIKFCLFISIDIFNQYIDKHTESTKLMSIYKTYNDLIEIIETGDKQSVNFGQCTRESGLLSFNSFDLALKSVTNGQNDAILTLPISKEAWFLAEKRYNGHTEYIDFVLGKSANPLMILFTSNFRVALTTVHIPISDVSSKITKELLLSKWQSFKTSLIKDFGIDNPKIAILGLNPHAGDGGTIGYTELDIISPFIAKLKLKANKVDGPFAADAFFARKMYELYDGVLAMYHDQGLIPLKMVAGVGGVNFTAGSDIIRTSPDHGTAFEIAGLGLANSQSTFEAILAINDIFNNRRLYDEQE